MTDRPRKHSDEPRTKGDWLIIRETPLAPYNQDLDPAGLYGGREVDDRPSLMEFYREDAIKDQIFAILAPSKAPLAVARDDAESAPVAAKLAEATRKV